MITLKIVLIGILTLVPEGGWENPERIYVLLNSGNMETATAYETPHQAVLFFDPEHLMDAPGPATAFLYADRDCSRLPMLAFQPPRAAWLFGGLELTLDRGASAGDPRKTLEALRCVNFTDRSADPTADCGGATGSQTKVRHDIRWLLDVTELYGSSLSLDPACLATPVGASCRDALAARLVLDSGLVSTRTLSGERNGEWLEWGLAQPGDDVPDGATGVTFAGSLQVEIRYAGKDAVSLYQRSLASAPDDPSLPALTLRPRAGENTVVITIENVPLSERLPTANPCILGDPPEQLDHAMMLYELAKPRPNPRTRRIPKKPMREGGGGVHDTGTPRCEPPGSFAYPVKP